MDQPKINMFLRWMVRNDNKGVDFGIWKKIKPKYLSCPLDIHSGRIARKIGILKKTKRPQSSNRIRLIFKNFGC